MRDSRIDKGLLAVCGLLLMFGIYSFQRLEAGVNGLTTAVSELRTEVAVMRTVREDLVELKAAYRDHVKAPGHVHVLGVLRELSRRVDKLEDHRPRTPKLGPR